MPIIAIQWPQICIYLFFVHVTSGGHNVIFHIHKFANCVYVISNLWPQIRIFVCMFYLLYGHNYIFCHVWGSGAHSEWAWKHLPLIVANSCILLKLEHFFVCLVNICVCPLQPPFDLDVVPCLLAINICFYGLIKCFYFQPFVFSVFWTYQTKPEETFAVNLEWTALFYNF